MPAGRSSGSGRNSGSGGVSGTSASSQSQARVTAQGERGLSRAVERQRSGGVARASAKSEAVLQKSVVYSSDSDSDFNSDYFASSHRASSVPSVSGASGQGLPPPSASAALALVGGNPCPLAGLSQNQVPAGLSQRQLDQIKKVDKSAVGADTSKGKISVNDIESMIKQKYLDDSYIPSLGSGDDGQGHGSDSFVRLGS